MRSGNTVSFFVHSIIRLKDWVGRVNTYLQTTLDEFESVFSTETQFSLWIVKKKFRIEFLEITHRTRTNVASQFSENFWHLGIVWRLQNNRKDLIRRCRECRDSARVVRPWNTTVLIPRLSPRRLYLRPLTENKKIIQPSC